MTKFIVTMNCDNAAFGDEPESLTFGCEIARILRDIADQVECGYAMAPLYDINGNRVGTAGLETGE